MPTNRIMSYVKEVKLLLFNPPKAAKVTGLILDINQGI